MFPNESKNTGEYFPFIGSSLHLMFDINKEFEINILNSLFELSKNEDKA